MAQSQWLKDILAQIEALVIAGSGDPATKAKVDALTKQLATDEGNAAVTTTEFQTAIKALVDKVAALTPPSLPVVASVVPASASLAGGEPITLTGTAFLGATAVKINGVSATNVAVNDDNSLTFTNPAQTAPGAYDVIVTTPAGDSMPTTADTLTIA